MADKPKNGDDKMAMENVKLIAVGDGAVGKTCLLMSYAVDKFPEDYVPTVFDNYNCTMVYNDKITVSLGLWDTAGQDDYEQMRPLAYPGTHVFLVCFSLIHRTSFQNVEAHWIKEIRNFDPKVPFVLCGTKKDLLENAELLKKLEERGENPIASEEAQELSKKLNAYAYVECSAKTQKGLSEVFYKCAEAGLKFQGILNSGVSKTQNNASSSQNTSKKGCCLLQ